MTELSFSRQFLSALDSRPIKLSSDHISDPKSFSAQAAPILPRLPHPPHPTSPKRKTSTPPTSTNPGAAPADTSISITLKPMRASQDTITISSIPASTTSIYDLKTQYSDRTSTPLPKIKLLYKKKPTADSKTIAEILSSSGDGDAKEVEFSVMVMGGAVAASGAGTPPVEVPREKGELGGGGSVGGPAAQGASGKEVLQTEEFWEDLRGFLVQRLRDEGEGERLVGLFRGVVR